MVESVEEEGEEGDEGDGDEGGEDGRGVYSGGGCLCHDDGGGFIVEVMGKGLVEGEPEVDLAMGDVLSELGFEVVVCDIGL